jgi:hypothetical protein
VEITRNEYEILKELQDLLIQYTHNRLLLKPRYESRHVIDDEVVSLALILPIGTGEQDEQEGNQLMNTLNSNLKRKDDQLLDITQVRSIITKLNKYM